MPEPVGAERIECATDRSDALGLSRVRHRTEAAVFGDSKRRRKRLGRESRLPSAETEADDATVAVLDRIPHRLERGVDGKAARDVGRETYLDTRRLLRLFRAVAEPGEDFVP